MRKYEIMNEFFDGGCCGYVINEDMLVKEDYIKNLVDGSDDVRFDKDSDELLVGIGNGINAVISYL